MRFVDWYCDEATRYIDRHMRVGPRLAAVAGGFVTLHGGTA